MWENQKEMVKGRAILYIFANCLIKQQIQSFKMIIISHDNGCFKQAKQTKNKSQGPHVAATSSPQTNPWVH